MGQQIMTQVLNPGCCMRHDFYIFKQSREKQYFVTCGNHMKLKLLCRQIKFNENTATVICLQLSKSAFAIQRELSCEEDKDCVWYFTLLLSAQQISMTRDDDSISGVRHTVILQHFKLPVGSSHIKTRTKQTLKSCFFLFCNFGFIFLICIQSSPFFVAQHVGFWFPAQGPNPCPLQWKHRFLTTGPPG